MKDADLPILYVVFDENGEETFTTSIEDLAHETINKAASEGIPVEGWIVRKYAPVRTYRLSSLIEQSASKEKQSDA